MVNFHGFCHLWLHFEHCLKKVSKKYKFLVFPSKINVFVHTGLSIVAACGRCSIVIPASTRRLMELFASEVWFLGVCSTIGKLLSCDTCVHRLWCWCDGGLCGVKMRPVRNSGIWFVLGCLSCHHVMSVRFPIKVCPWDRQLTYLVRNVLSSLMFYIWHM